ncbi:uncharacterized protein BXIN_1335 [Babesia sp. Xinjiang]|uniref:uncharacterized protein n=1 Tax=Babesia sp. Xinjiang TaxID=462227 RepID=UPI000A2659CA|nr:uncharacterized protein BXIN_1335 [Babesia sp. Xinjiang]ORM40132.1 hypothetical protein BXIN_1335 [Babesia sp. Xinjiang]
MGVAMDASASRFADPLKDYGFDPSSLSRATLPIETELDEASREILNTLSGLSGGLNLFPSVSFDIESTPGTALSRRLDWLSDFSPGNAKDSDPDVHDDVHPDDLFDGADLQSRLTFYMFGGHSTQPAAEESYASWDLPDSHPVRPSLRKPNDDNYCWNSNWYERLQWAYRSALPRTKRRGSMYILGSDEEHEVLLELGRFSRASCRGATTLLMYLLQYGLETPPSGYIEVTERSSPKVDQFYHRKFPDDRQFIHDGIVYTLVIGRKGVESALSYTMAKKMYSNDQKGKQALCEALYSRGSYGKFAIPVQCIVDYLGIRVVAEPLVPLATSSPIDLVSELIRDCRAPSGEAAIDISSALFAHPELFESLKGISSYLHLCSWPIPFEASDVSGFLCSISGTPTGLISEGACASVQRCDGYLHIRQTQEVLPPILDNKSEVDPLFSSRFRPEFCFSYNGNLRCTVRSASVYGDRREDDQFVDAFNHLQVLLEDCVGRCNELFDSWDLREVFHSFGVNMRYLGMAYERAVYAGLKSLLAADMVARAVKHLWDVQLQEFFANSNLGLEWIMRRLLRMVNDAFGLFSESADFWSQCIIPEVAKHFNLINVDGMSYRLLPHLLLKGALELHLGILLPPPLDGMKYRSPLMFSDFMRIEVSQILSRDSVPNSDIFYDEGLSTPRSDTLSAPPISHRPYGNLLDALFPKVAVVRPQFELPIIQAATKLYKKDDLPLAAKLVFSASTWRMGSCRQLECRLVGVGYPCDPACVYSSHMSCVNYQQRMTGLNLLCLSECLSQLDSLKRAKLLVLMGYEYMRHRYYKEALQCAEFVLKYAPPLCRKRLEARLLALQCHCLTGATSRSSEVYESLNRGISALEGCVGLLSLQSLVFMALEAWLRRDFDTCASFASLARDTTLSISGIIAYEWLPLAVVSLLSHCERSLGRGVDAIKTQREAVRLCNVSHLPRFTLCNQTWLFVEYLLRNDSYEEGCSLSMELVPKLESEFGSLSVECLRGLYVSAWANHQVGCGHLLHPMLYLCSSDRVREAHTRTAGIQGSLLLEEFVIADICSMRLKHRSDALDLYKSLYERLCVLLLQSRRDIASYVRGVYPSTATDPIEKLPRLNQGIVTAVLPDFNLEEDALLSTMVANSERYHEKLLLVIRNLLTLKLLSLSSASSMSVARRLYNAYVSQVSDGYIFKLCVGGEEVQAIASVIPSYGNTGNSRMASVYGSRVERQPERFSASVSIRQNSVPHRGHELRSIEELLLKAPNLTVGAICEICRTNLLDSSDTPSEWFDRLFELDASAGSGVENSFTLFLDVLRNLLTPSKRLVILGHVASISGAEVDTTTTFTDLRQALEFAIVR